MKFVLFTHSLVSDWNHGNAHFLRGVMSALIERGHKALALEPAGGWSLLNLIAEDPLAPARFAAQFPGLSSIQYNGVEEVEEHIDEADVVIVHEWTPASVVSFLSERRQRGCGFLLLFHDTHHRAVSDPAAIAALDLSGYDGVLAFGEAISEIYRALGWGRRVWTWHEAADVTRFRPLEGVAPEADVVWIGNWGDGERTREMEEFLLEPVSDSGLKLRAYGVRYPQSALSSLRRIGADYGGWLANARVPEAYARARMTVHVPRRFYVDRLPGVPTIRVFEALACGVPLISAPWRDEEQLFRPGEDFLMVKDSAEAERAMRLVSNDAERAHALRTSGLEQIRKRHTCAHRVEDLLSIISELRGSAPVEDVQRAAAI